MLPLVSVAYAWPLLGPEGVPTHQAVVASALFEPDGVRATRVATDPAALRVVAADALRYLRAWRGRDSAATEGLFAELGASSAEHALERIVGATDTELVDPSWISANFTVWRRSEPIRVTRYLVRKAEGRASRDATFDQALWSDPGEHLRGALTRRRLMQGATPGGTSRPLVWLREADVHDALMQGTVEVALPDGTKRMFNVDVSNGIPYAKGKTGRDQDRLWYFREVDGARGYGKEAAERIALRAGVSVAGDVYNLGVGRLIALRYTEGGRETLRLAVLADTGGAFQPNLTQLDWFGGAFETHAQLYAAFADLPERTELLVLTAP
jgi:hypothetical protein